MNTATSVWNNKQRLDGIRKSSPTGNAIAKPRTAFDALGVGQSLSKRTVEKREKQFVASKLGLALEKDDFTPKVFEEIQAEFEKAMAASDPVWEITIDHLHSVDMITAPNWTKILQGSAGKGITLDTKLRVTKVEYRGNKVRLCLSRPIIAEVGANLEGGGTVAVTSPVAADFCPVAFHFSPNWSDDAISELEKVVLREIKVEPLLKAKVGRRCAYVFPGTSDAMRKKEFHYNADEKIEVVIGTMQYLDKEACFNCGVRGHASRECKDHWSKEALKTEKKVWKAEPIFVPRKKDVKRVKPSSQQEVDVKSITKSGQPEAGSSQPKAATPAKEILSSSAPNSESSEMTSANTTVMEVDEETVDSSYKKRHHGVSNGAMEESSDSEEPKSGKKPKAAETPNEPNDVNMKALEDFVYGMELCVEDEAITGWAEATIVEGNNNGHRKPRSRQWYIDRVRGHNKALGRYHQVRSCKVDEQNGWKAFMDIQSLIESMLRSKGINDTKRKVKNLVDEVAFFGDLDLLAEAAKKWDLNWAFVKESDMTRTSPECVWNCLGDDHCIFTICETGGHAPWALARDESDSNRNTVELPTTSGANHQ